MNFAKTLLLSILFLGANLISISSSEASNNIDNNKNKITRVVALNSLSADLVNNISNESLLGIPGSSLFKNDDDFVNKTVISSGRTPPNLEKILNLKPQLVIGSRGFHDKTLARLQDLGIQTISSSVSNFSDLEELSSNLQILLDKDHKFDLVKTIPNCYNLKHNRNLPSAKEVLVLVSSKPILSPNSESWAGNMINRFGYINLTSELDGKSQFKGYVNLSPEWVIASMPSNLIIINTPGRDDSQYKQLSIWNDLPAVINNNVSSFDYYGLINAGNLSSIDKACQKLLSI